MRTALLALAFFVAGHAFAQTGPTFGPNYRDQYNPIPGPQLASPSIPTPAFPLQVRLYLRGTTWNGYYDYYAGEGTFRLASADPATPVGRIHFEYQCGVTFLKPQVNQFQARWTKPDKTLQILLYDPGSPEKPRTCDLTVLAHPPQKIPY